VSELCLKNLIQAKCWGKMIRTGLMRRDEARFYADLGTKPMTVEEAVDLAASGGAREVCRGRWGYLTTRPALPALPLDCLAPYDRMLADYNQSVEDAYADDYMDWHERQAEREWEDTDAGRRCIAHLDAEREREELVERQCEKLWALHENSNLFELPIFMTRVIEPAAQVRASW
jgi:hypothetical protein